MTLHATPSDVCGVRPLTLADIRPRATISPEEASEVLGMGLRQTYAALRDGTIPSLRLSRRYRVPVPALLRMLGEEVNHDDQ